MAASNAKLGAGSAIYINTSITAVPGTNLLADWEGAGGSWALLVDEPKEIGLPGAEPSDIEVTHLLSPSRDREYIPGPKETGTIEGTANFTPADYADMMSKAGTKYGMKIVTVATGTADDGSPDLDCVVYFMGHLSVGNPTMTFEGVREVPFSVKVDSSPVIDSTP